MSRLSHLPAMNQIITKQPTMPSKKLQ